MNLCEVIPAAVGRCDLGTPSCITDHRSTGCPVQTEMQGHTFRCQLRDGHWPEDHAWWLAAPVYGPTPLWTADNLIEDDWEA